MLYLGGKLWQLKTSNNYVIWGKADPQEAKRKQAKGGEIWYVISVHVTPPNRANCQRREDHSANRTHTDSMVLCSPSGRRKLQYSGGIWQHDCGTEPHCVCLENFPSPGTWRAPRRPVSLLSLSSSGPKATRERNPPLLSAMNTTAKRAYYSFFSLSLSSASPINPHCH
jgi:hypothetical protein